MSHASIDITLYDTHILHAHARSVHQNIFLEQNGDVKPLHAQTAACIMYCVLNASLLRHNAMGKRSNNP